MCNAKVWGSNGKYIYIHVCGVDAPYALLLEQAELNGHYSVFMATAALPPVP